MIDLKETKPGSLVKLKASNAPGMVLVSSFESQHSADCKYWNKKIGEIEEVALFDFELEAHVSEDEDYSPTFEPGDRVSFGFAPAFEMVVNKRHVSGNTYDCHYFNKLSGKIDTKEFEGYELRKVGDETQTPEFFII